MGPRRHSHSPSAPPSHVSTRSARSPTSARSPRSAARRTQPRVFAPSSSAPSLLVLTLAVVGVFGVLAYSVQRRVRGFGVRIALGATTRHVLLMVFRSTIRITEVGLIIGLAAAALLGRSMSSFVFGVRPRRPRCSASAGRYRSGATRTPRTMANRHASWPPPNISSAMRRLGRLRGVSERPGARKARPLRPRPARNRLRRNAGGAFRRAGSGRAPRSTPRSAR